MEKLFTWLGQAMDLWPAANEFERGFQAALILSALVFLLLIVFCLILKLIFRKPAVPGVVLSREDGDIFISRSAIFTAICRLESEFTDLEIMKVTMQRNRHHELGLTVTVMFDEHDKSFDALAGEFKQRVFGMLNKSFGIESVKSVSIVLARIPAERELNGEDNNPPVVNNAFVSGI